MNDTRLLTPCDDGTCQWVHSPVSSDQRWYPTVETLEDGRAIIVSHDLFIRLFLESADAKSLRLEVASGAATLTMQPKITQHMNSSHQVEKLPFSHLHCQIHSQPICIR